MTDQKTSTWLAFILMFRPHQWVKNLFLFLPIFFAGEIFNIAKLTQVGMGFAIFCLGSSVIYIFNDLMDMKVDRLHPEKSKRPLASGVIKPAVAYISIVALLIIIVPFSIKMGVPFASILGTYMLMNLLYSLGLKRISILDIIIVSTGFVFRTIAGGITGDVYISHWLIIMIFLLALFLVIAKRREDMLVFVSTGKVLRKSIEKYNLEFINSLITMISGVIIVSYIMYTISDEVNERIQSDYLYGTSIFVIIGILRYLQITIVENKSGSPVKVLYTDTFIHVTLVLWITSFYLILYVLNI